MKQELLFPQDEYLINQVVQVLLKIEEETINRSGFIFFRRKDVEDIHEEKITRKIA